MYETECPATTERQESVHFSGDLETILAEIWSETVLQVFSSFTGDTCRAENQPVTCRAGTGGRDFLSSVLPHPHLPVLPSPPSAMKASLGLHLCLPENSSRVLLPFPRPWPLHVHVIHFYFLSGTRPKNR